MLLCPRLLTPVGTKSTIISVYRPFSQTSSSAIDYRLKHIPCLREKVQILRTYRTVKSNVGQVSFPSITSTSGLEEQILEEQQIMAEEKDVGILCFVNSLSGFRGILKQRHFDFVVHEVDSFGKLVELTSLEVPPELKDAREVKLPQGTSILPSSFGTPNWESDSVDFDFSPLFEAFGSLASPKDLSLFTDFIKEVSKGNLRAIEPLIFEGSSDKNYRTEIHNFMKLNVPSSVTDTVDTEEGLKAVRLRIKGGRRGGQGGNQGENRGKKRGRYDSRGDKGPDPWKGQPMHLLVHLYKENLETQHAINVLARSLGIQSKCFGFAGTKDKRGVTVQRITIFRQTAERVASLNPSLFNMKLGNFRYVDDRLNLGQLGGNRFTIVLREIEAETPQIVSEAALALQEKGFLNYFGLQRFGSGSVGTHKIGASLLRGDWKEAINLILGKREGEREDVSKARSLWEMNDLSGALEAMPRYMVAECAVLSALVSQSEGSEPSSFSLDKANLVQALGGVPRTLRMMYVHGYQSYVWNKAASHRIQVYGSGEAIEGDLVAISSHGLEFEDAYSVKHVTADDVASKKYRIEDVVLPLIGNTVLYPRNSTFDIYKSTTNEDGIDLEKCDHKVKEYSVEQLKGDYRRVLIKPKDFAWEVLKYSDPSISLISTDLEKIGQKLTEKSAHTLVEGMSFKEKTALKLQFVLPTSVYATMLIRELLKCSSSVEFHKGLADGQSETIEVDKTDP